MKCLKKVIAIIGIIITFFIIYFLQINFFSWFNISGVKPNLFIVLILCIALFIERKVAITLGIIFGFYLDILTNNQVGASSLMFAIIAILGCYLDKSFSKDNKITLLLMVAGSTMVFETAIYMYTIVKNLIPIQILGFLKILLIEILFNVLLTIILYPLIKKVEYLFEDTFKKNKVLTRYF